MRQVIKDLETLSVNVIMQENLLHSEKNVRKTALEALSELDKELKQIDLQIEKVSRFQGDRFADLFKRLKRITKN